MITCKCGHTIFQHDEDLTNSKIVIKPDNQKEIQTTIVELMAALSRLESIKMLWEGESTVGAMMGIKDSEEPNEAMRIIPLKDVRGFVSEMIRKEAMKSLQQLKHQEVFETFGPTVGLAWAVGSLKNKLK